MADWKKAGKAWATGGASLVYDKAKDKDKHTDAGAATPAGARDAEPSISKAPDACGVINDRSRLHQKANDALDQNLYPGERVEVIVTGPSSQAVIGTDRRVFIYKKGFMAGATFGAEITSWDYRNLNGVQIHTGAMSGALILQAPGQSGTKTNTWKQGDGDPYKAPNAIPLVRPWLQAQEGVVRLRQLIEAAQRPSAPAPQVTSRTSLADELQKLAALRDSGVLSDDEFATLKADLIAKA